MVVFVMQLTVLTENVQAEEHDYLSTIEEIVHWKKSSLNIAEDDPLLQKHFLKNAGDTTGDWFPLGLGRIAYPDAYEAYLAVIANEVTDRYKGEHQLSEAKVTEWHRISLAILAMGGDPTNIGRNEKGEPINLIADGTYHRAKTNSIGAQGLNGWIWALISLDSLRYEVPAEASTKRGDIIKEIMKSQLKDGGFSLSEEESDPDMTGMAITALAPYYNSEETYSYVKVSTNEKVSTSVREVVNEALHTLSDMQLDSGGYAMMGMENTESIVQVIVALTSLGIDLFSDERFIKNGNNMYDALMNFQMTDGGFVHAKKYDEENPTAKPNQSNAMASDQALYALVALYRFEHGYRSLYDFREELSSEIKKDMEQLTTEIDLLDKGATKETVATLFANYKKLPVEERSYVYNYAKLADKMNELKMENDSDSFRDAMELHKSGNGAITPMYTNSLAKESTEVTSDDLAKIEEIVGESSTEYAVEVVTLLDKLAASSESYTEEIGQLENEKVKIDERQAEIDNLNETIVNELFPIENIQVKDKKQVEAIMISYESLSEYDKQQVINYEDVEKAEAQIASIERKRNVMIILSAVLIIGIGLVLYRRKQRKQAKRAKTYLNE